MYWLIGKKKNLYLHVCVKDGEREEAKSLIEQLGYTIIEDRKMGKSRRFKGKETHCLTYLRKQMRKD